MVISQVAVAVVDTMAELRAQVVQAVVAQVALQQVQEHRELQTQVQVAVAVVAKVLLHQVQVVQALSLFVT